MLQIKNISKRYVTGDLVQMALDDVSLNFRDNEFVAVLGPSGSGKTTLLNIVGGLDRYDEGDLIINGISTKNYTDRDWDSYRNHTIGFVFQSYNLIPHQTILSNVELALTISGVPRAERRERAKEALETVGLGDQIHKRPNQLSGGQMQRVAIARALINNPDILLADEPTGALDTETSVQVMNLLKEVAKDRMVIMVTHNPDLATEYATRIVRLQDGRIVDDTDPYYVDETALAPAVHQNMGHSSMSLMTSLSLSVNNLLIKRRRTLLTAFAGSIGIIAIALILAVSAGVNAYIDTLEEDTMSEYPIEVTSSGFDISSMLGTVMGTMTQLVGGDEDEDGIRVMTMISRMVTVMNSNDLASFKTYIEGEGSDIYDYAKAVEYIYDVDPQIYLEDGNTYHQVNPESVLTSEFGLSSTLTSMMSSMTLLHTFFQLPESDALYKDSYEIKAGRWPESYNECVLVLSSNGTIADYVAYTLGLRDFSEYEWLVEAAMNGVDVSSVEYNEVYAYDDIVGTTYKLVNNADYYEYDREYGVWTDKRDNESYMRQLVADGEDLTIVGVVQPLEDATTAILSEGINYPSSLIEHVAEVAETSAVVQDQLDHPDVNVLTGQEFGEDAGLDLGSIFTLDEDVLDELWDLDAIQEEMDFPSLDLDSDALDFSSMELDLDSLDLDFSDMGSDMDLDLSGMDLDLDLDMSDLESAMDFDLSGMDLDLSGLDLDLSGLELNLDLDFSDLSLDMSAMEFDLSSMLEGLDLSSFTNVNSDGMRQVAQSLLSGYDAYAQLNGLSTYANMQADFANYLTSADAQNILRNAINEMVQSATDEISTEDVRELLTNLEGNDEEIRQTLVSWMLEALNRQELPASLTGELVDGYMTYAAVYGQTTADSISEGLTDYLSSDAAVLLVTQGMMGMIDMDGLQEAVSSMMDSYMEQMMSSITTAMADQVQSQISSAMDDMTVQLEAQMAEAMSGVTDQIQAQMTAAMGGMTAQIQAQMTEAMSGMTAQLEAQLTEAMSGMTDQIQEQMTEAMSGLTPQIQDQLTEAMSGMTDQMTDMITETLEGSMDEWMDGLTDSFSIDPDTIMDAFSVDMDEDSLMELMTSMSSAVGSSYAGVLADLGYVDYDSPTEIDIYPKDFDSKDGVTAVIDRYNNQMAEAGEEEKEISYTDLVGTMMSTVSTIINLVSYVLIAFVSVSLVVSSIMIGIITYISVLERTREIGILRALGASKRNVGRIFNAETFIVGLVAGILGVVIALLILIPVNMVVHNFVQAESARAFLPAGYGVILIILSVVLTLIGGIIPSRKASKMDPVMALRTE